MRLARALIGLSIGLAVVAGCERTTPEQRAKAALEGRNLDGTSAPARDDRVPVLAGDRVTPRAGYLAGAFAVAHVEPAAIAWFAPVLTRQWPELAELGSVLTGARASGSVRSVDGGLHLRVHVWMDANESVEAAAITLLGSQECADIHEAIACGGSSSGFAVVRATSGGYVVDALLGGSDRRAQIGEAVARASGEAPAELAELRGHALVSIDGPAAIEALRSAAPELGDTLGRLRDTERLFAGMTFELAIADGQLRGRGRWQTTGSGRERLREVFELDPVDADVPSLAALCAGAVACGRGRGLPNRERFIGLATGIYSEPETILALLDRPEAPVMLVMLVMALETWPNAIAAGVRWPGDVTDPGEAMILQSTAEIARRVLGFGFSIRADGAELGYARMGAADLETIARFAALAGSGFSPLALEDVEARVESMSARGRGMPSRIYRVVDPGEAWGWLVAADHDEQIAWLTGLAHDDGAVPLAYVEIPELGQLLAVRPEWRRWFGWLGSELGIRAQLSVAADGAPELRFVVGEL